MADDTPGTYRNLVIYEVYVRNHGAQGTFAEVEADLPRLAEMGVDVVWFMPIHPIGKIARKGTLGSPYSIVDYRAINPEYGTREDFERLIARAHALGLKVMIDVVYNHTAHDSVLLAAHPEWFHQDAAGQPMTTVPEWSDVIDLKHPNPDLTAYLIETLQGWAQLGVDGFRCDVASIVPLSFWLEARAAVAAVRPGVIWLAESVHAAFVEERRRAGLSGHSDGEIYQAFDLTYDYDIWPLWQATVSGMVPVRRYLEILRFQDAIYPASYVKMRCVENHDQLRIMALSPSQPQALAWTAFQAFNRGPFLIYGGQEAAATHTPSLFEVDKVDWGSYALQPFLTTLAHLKKHPALTEGQFTLAAAEPVIQAAWQRAVGGLYGVFNVRSRRGQVEVHLPDGTYEDLLGGAAVTVANGQMAVPETACILEYQMPLPIVPLAQSELLDFRG
jgi:hypothetical protein